MSVKATEKLIEKAGVKLMSDCPTRWSSSYLLMCWLLKVKVHLVSVLEDLGLDNLPNSHWKQLENIVALLKPFARYTTLCSAEESTTIFTVVPIILELSMHLEHVNGSSSIYPTLT
jgi:hypothetical protein